MTPLEAFKQQYKETRERKAEIKPFFGYFTMEQSYVKEEPSKWYRNKWDKINSEGFKTQSYKARKIKQHYIDLFGFEFYKSIKHKICNNTGTCLAYLPLKYRSEKVIVKGNNFIPIKVFEMMERLKLKELKNASRKQSVK